MDTPKVQDTKNDYVQFKEMAAVADSCLKNTLQEKFGVEVSFPVYAHSFLDSYEFVPFEAEIKYYNNKDITGVITKKKEKICMFVHPHKIGASGMPIYIAIVGCYKETKGKGVELEEPRRIVFSHTNMDIKLVYDVYAFNDALKSGSSCSIM